MILSTWYIHTILSIKMTNNIIPYRLEEERVRLAIETKRREEEKRAQKKEREKQKKEQLKAEGKWLTPAQKAAKARADAALEAMRAQGAEVDIFHKIFLLAEAQIRKNLFSWHLSFSVTTFYDASQSRYQ